MSTISMHAATVPVFTRQLLAMLPWLDKAEAHAAARKFDPNNFLQWRLTPDMLPFASQIRIAGDTAKGAVSRLAGQEPPKYEDNEATIAELRERIRKTVDFIGSVPASAFEGSETREIVLPMRNRDPLRFQGLAYVQHWVLPNFFFHCTTAYALLRHGGVELGKGDFLANP